MEAMKVTALERVPEPELRARIEGIRALVNWLGERRERRGAVVGLLGGIELELARRMARPDRRSGSDRDAVV
jgi:hypothetical protein